MATATIRVKTYKQWNHIPSIIKSLRSESARATYNFARTVAAEARRRAPVRTGYLRSSIVNEKVDYGHHRVTVGAHYGAFVEYGTRHMAPRPYFRPAVEVAKREFEASMKGWVHHR